MVAMARMGVTAPMEAGVRMAVMALMAVGALMALMAVTALTAVGDPMVRTAPQRQKRLAGKRIPDSFDYSRVTHLRIEAREKLSRIRPVNLAQAGRISGLTPADLAVLMVHLNGYTASARH